MGVCSFTCCPAGNQHFGESFNSEQEHLELFFHHSLSYQRDSAKCVQYLLEDDIFRIYFVKYVVDKDTTVWHRFFTYLQNIDKVDDLFVSDTYYAESIEELIALYADVDERSALGVILDDVKHINSTEPKMDGIQFRLLVKCIGKEIAILAAPTDFHHFLTTPIYRDWRQLEMDALKKYIGSFTTDSTEPDSIKIDLSKEENVDNALDCCLERLEPTELPYIVNCSSWFLHFITIAELCPLSICIAAADSNRKRGFPIIYINEAFTSLTGYEHREILGLNCSLLQSTMRRAPPPDSPLRLRNPEKETQETASSANTQVQRIKQLSKCLADGHPHQTVLRNYKKNGTSFLNLLTLRPLKDRGGNYCYVVGVQMDVSDYRYSYQSAIRNLNWLLRFLPQSL